MTPPDIMERARSVLVGRRLAFNNESGPDALIDAIAAALLAERERERERCARIASDYAVTEMCTEHANHAVAANASGNVAGLIRGHIATAIRGGTPNG